MTTPALIETATYRVDGSCLCRLGQTVVLDVQLEEPSEGHGPVEYADISGRFFLQRLYGRDGAVLAEVEPTRPDDFTVRFTLTVAAGVMPEGAKAVDLSHTIVELLEDGEDDVITRPFSVRGLRSGLPGAQLSIGETGRLVVRYAGTPGLSAAQQLKDAGLIESNSGDALADYLRAPALGAAETAGEATDAANAAAALANTKAALADEKAGLAAAEAAQAHEATEASVIATAAANGATGAATSATAQAGAKAAEAQAAADAANEVALGQKVKWVTGSYVVQAADHLKLIISTGGEIYLDADLPDTLMIEFMPAGVTPVEVFPGVGATVNGAAGKVALTTQFGSAKARPVSATGWAVSDGEAVAPDTLITRPQFNTPRAGGQALAWFA